MVSSLKILLFIYISLIIIFSDKILTNEVEKFAIELSNTYIGTFKPVCIFFAFYFTF